MKLTRIDIVPMSTHQKYAIIWPSICSKAFLVYIARMLTMTDTPHKDIDHGYEYP
jgi:hypothetical protein